MGSFPSGYRFAQTPKSSRHLKLPRGVQDGSQVNATCAFSRIEASDSFNAKKNIVNNLSSYKDTQRLKRGCSSTNKIYVMDLSCPLHAAAEANLISQDSTWHMGRLRCRASARWSFQIHPGNRFDALCVSIPPLDTLQKQQTNDCTLSATDLCGGSLFPIVRSC